MDPADDAARAQKRRRLNDDYCLEPQHAEVSSTNNALYDQNGCGSTSIYELSGPSNPTDTRAERAAVRTTLDDASLECCYGMLCDIPVTFKSTSNGLRTDFDHLPVSFEHPNKLSSRSESNPTVLEITESDVARVLCELHAAVEITTQIYCHAKDELPYGGRPKTSGRQRKRMIASWSLNVIIYGPVSLEKTVGDFMTSCQMYLQDPLCCDHSVVYRNPHIMSSETGETIMTDCFQSTLGNLEIERLDVGPDLLAQLMEDETPLRETDAPAIVTATLFPHQKQALTFMLHREHGWSMDERNHDIWTKEKDSMGRVGYRNNVSGNYQDEPPLSFRGGLLADDMGLGKTLSMICVIAANQASQLPSPPITPEPLNRIPCQFVKTTLLVVPPPLIQTWQKQFQIHIRLGALKLHVFHGQNRKGVQSLGQYDVVITTFHTVSAIWRKQTEPHDSPESLFALTWHRIVLDEAHMIQNAQSQLAQACCALRSERKWALTGTPIQNKLTDFASIVRFLGVYPYSQQRVFDDEISRPWYRGDPQGFLRLKALVRAIAISRSKSVVHLPHRVDEIHHLDFTAAEREVYDTAKRHTVTLLDDAISTRSQGGAAFNALQRLNILRLICCHGLLTRSNQATRAIQSRENFAETFCHSKSQILLCEELLGGPAACSQCGVDLLEEFLEGSPPSVLDTPQRTTRCGDMLCQQCTNQVKCFELDQASWYHQNPITDDINMSPDPSLDEDIEMVSIDSMSTKIKALVADILNHHLVEKSVVFSFWTYTLDLVQLMLDDCGIEYTRIDGKTPLSKRTEALRAFQKNDSLRVILVSITCGGAGLDLTAASRVYLLEPHWNPMIEEQALCRVHRVGQQRNVTTVRYLMRDSFEEQVVEIQKRKRMLAQVTFGQGPLTETGIGLGTLQYLKSLISS